MVEKIISINETVIHDAYDAVFCDVWGVLHNGIAAYANALTALKEWRKAGKVVIFVTNSPRFSKEIICQLENLKVMGDVYDGVVTSGDATRYLIEKSPEKIYFIGPHALEHILEKTQHSLVDEQDAEAVVCTGLFRNNEEDLERYRPLLKRLSERKLPFICANPDIIVDYGGKKQWCAGALAKIYEEYGGKVLMAGKPHTPIYRLAFNKAACFHGLAPLYKERILAIGDGLQTDIAGALTYGIDCLFIANGIHQFEPFKEGPSTSLTSGKVETLFERYKTYPKYWMDRLN